MILSQTAAEQPIIYTRPVVCCIVPTDLAGRLHGLLHQWFRHDPSVEVIVERRGATGRRSSDAGPPGGVERRMGERRAAGGAVTVADEDWDLPWGARRHADRLALALIDVPVHGRDEARVERMLIERVRGGDGVAADELYARWYPRVHDWSHSGSRRRAEQLTQDIFAEAFARMGDPELDQRRPDRWVRTIAASVTDRG